MAFIQFPEFNLRTYTDLLKPETPALWGSMTAQHMLEHMLLPLQIGRGVLSVEVITPSEKVEKTKLLFLMSEAPLKRGFPAPFLKDGLQDLNYKNLDEAVEALQNEINSFVDFWENNPDSVFNHPVFGPLNKQEWMKFQSKHFTHHFTQFGIFEG